MSDSSDFKYCSDCKHFRPFMIGWWIFKFRYPGLEKCAQELEPVNGEPSKFCEFKRGMDGTCGPKGKFWEAKGH